jgi:AcrR family transcriptional regulator
VNQRVEGRPRKRRSDGERSREAILREAARLATVEGIDGLSVGRLADAVGMSKSGLFAHFGSKEDLQLATIDWAVDLFGLEVTEPALGAATGRERLGELVENFLRHVVEGYPGGCFFASIVTEMDARPGPLRDRAVQIMRGWLELLETTVAQAQAEGTIAAAEDPKQLAFELEAAMFLANVLFVATREPDALARARLSIARRLATAAAGSGS